MERALILGSCISRDIYNYYEEPDFRIAEYYARTSLISLMSPPPSEGVNVALDRISSPFQRRVVGYELSRDLLTRLPSIEFDYLLMDLIDERHDILEVEPGVYVTLTREFMETGYLDDNPATGKSVIQCGSVQHRVLWFDAMRRFMNFCEETGIKDRIVVNRSFWAMELSSGGVIPGTSATFTTKHNQILEWMYHMLEPMLQARQMLRVPSAHRVSDLAHRWGPSPFHYHDGYYLFLKARLQDFCRDR